MNMLYNYFYVLIWLELIALADSTRIHSKPYIHFI